MLLIDRQHQQFICINCRQHMMTIIYYLLNVFIYYIIVLYILYYIIILYMILILHLIYSYYISDSCDRCLQNEHLHNTDVVLLHNF